MTFDPRWLNQILPTKSGANISDLYSLYGLHGLDVKSWEGSVGSSIFSNAAGGLDLTPLRSGNIFVVYEDNIGYKATVRLPGGGAISGISPVSLGNGGVAGDAIRVATLANGNVVVAYIDTDSVVKYKIYDERLNVVETDKTVSGTSGMTHVSVSSLADGNFSISYSDATAKSAFQIFDIDGDIAKGETVVSTSYYTKVEGVGLNNGNIMFVLQQGGNLYYSIYNRQGTRIVAPSSLSTGKTLLRKSVGVLPNGQIPVGFLNTSNTKVGYILLDQDGNVAQTAVDRGATGKTVGSIAIHPRNAIAFISGSATQLFSSVDAIGKSWGETETILGSGYPLTAISAISSIVNANGAIISFIIDGTGIKANAVQETAPEFGSRGLSVAGLADIQTFSISGVGEIQNISNDPNLVGDPNTFLTDYAIKSYVDQQTGNVPRNVINENDSKIQVYDSTAQATQFITFVVNNNELARIEDLGASQTLRLGPSGDTRIDLNTSTDIVSVKSGSTEVLNLGTSTQVLGVATDTAISLDQSLNIISFKSANAAVAQFDANGLTLATGVAVNKFSNDATLGGYNGATGSDAIVASEKAVRGYIDGIHNAMRDPTGFVNRTDSSITFGVDGSNTLTITPTGASYDIFLRGQRYRKTVAASINITDVEGLHYVYFDSTGVLSHTTTWTIDLIYIYAYVAVIYWDATNKEATYVGDERHGIVMDGATHYNLHSSRGTVYLDGLGIGDLVADGTGSLNTEAEFSVSAGTIVDEDITTSIPIKTVPAQIPMFYRSGTGSGVWRSTTANNYPVTNAGSGRMAWNEKVGALTWGLTEAVEGYYVLSHIFATNDYDNSRKIIGIAGQTEYPTFTAAKEAASVEINNLVLSGLPFAEFVAIGTFIFQTSSSYTNAPKASLRSIGGGSDYMDWRYAKISSVPGVVTDHGSLSGLSDDDHLQYARLSGTRPFTGLITFNAGITVAGGSLTLATGSSVNKFSNDTTLVGDSSASVPTEHAVKSYVDTAINGLNPNKIWQGDSKVEVIDDSTHTGSIQIVADGVQVAHFDVLSSTQRIGKATESRLLVSDDSIVGYAGATPEDLFNITMPNQRFGSAISGGRLEVGMVGANLHVASTQIVSGQPTAQTFGVATDSRLDLDQTADTAKLYAGSSLLVDLGTNNQMFGLLGDTYVALTQSSNTITVAAGNSAVISATNANQRFGLATNSALTLVSGASGTAELRAATGATPTKLSLTTTTADLYVGATNIFSGTATAQTVGVAGDSRLVLDQAVDIITIYSGSSPALSLGPPQMALGFVNNSKLLLNNLGDQSVHLYSATTDILNGTTTAQTFGVASDSRLVLDQTADTAKLYAGSVLALDAGVNVVTLGTAADTSIALDQTGNTVVVKANNVTQGTFDVNGLTLNIGASINEFSTDDTLSGDSDDAVPTEKAVKSYVDSQIGGQANRIWEGNSEVRVTDDNTAVGVVAIKVDNVEVGNFQATSQIIGLAGDTRLQLSQSPDIASLFVANTRVIAAQDIFQRFGVSGSSSLEMSQSANTSNLFAGSIQIITGGTTAQTFGVASDSRLALDQSADTADLYAGTTQIIDGATTSQTFGVTGDSNLFLDQANNLADLFAGTTKVIDTEPQAQVFGVASDSRLALDQLNDTADLYAGTVRVLGATTNVLTLGTATDTYLSLNQNDNKISAYTGNTLQMLVEDTGVSVEGDLTVRGNLSIDGTAFIVFNEEVRTSDNIITVNYGDPGPGVTRGIAGLEIARGSSPIYQFIFQESSDTFRVGEVGDTQAVATREDDPDGYKVAWWSDGNRRFETLGDEYIKVDQTANNIVFVTGLSQRGQFDSNGLTLQLGTSVNEFSTDATLGGASNDAVPTEAAVKSYVDSQIGGQANLIFQGNSKVEVIDDSTHSGTVTITADGVDVSAFQAASQRVGLATDSKLVLATGTADLYAGASKVITTTATAQTVGISGDSRIVVDQSANTIDAYAGASLSVLSLGATSQTFGLAANSKVDLSTGTADLYAGATQIIDGATTSQTFGVASDSRLFLDQSNDLADLYAGTTQIIDGAMTSQTFGVSGDSRLVLDQTADTAKLYAGSVLALDAGLTLITIGTAADTNMAIDQGANTVVFESNNVTQATISTTGLALNAGASVSEFSIDTTLGGNSDAAVPTEKAVKTYVDTQINALRQELDLINVRNVYVDTTASTGDVILADTTAGDITIQLMESTDGKIIIKKKSSDGNKVYISTTPGLIDGQSQIIIDTGYQAYTFVCDGTNFFII